MSDERMMTMDEDEEIGQVRFVDVLCIYVFSVFSLSLFLSFLFCSSSLSLGRAYYVVDDRNN